MHPKELRTESRDRGMMVRRETRLSLKLFVKKAKRLQEGSYVRALSQQGGTKLKYSYRRSEDGSGGTVQIEHTHPDDDALDALVLNFRFFLQSEREAYGASFKWLADHIMDDPGLSNHWKHEFTDIRRVLNECLNQFSMINERVVTRTAIGSSVEVQVTEENRLTYREIMEVFIYGELAHANEKNWEIIERWQSNPLGYAFLQNEFDRVLMLYLPAIFYLAELSVRELEGLSGTQSGSDAVIA